jgi:hypothetical protein
MCRGVWHGRCRKNIRSKSRPKNMNSTGDDAYLVGVLRLTGCRGVRHRRCRGGRVLLSIVGVWISHAELHDVNALMRAACPWGCTVLCRNKLSE